MRTLSQVWAGRAQPALPLVAAVGWCTAAEGGTRPVDLALVTSLVVMALIQTHPTADDFDAVIRSPAAVAALAIVGWMTVAGLASSGWVLAAVRLPLVVAIGAVVVTTCSRLAAPQRRQVQVGLVAIGAVLAASAIAQWLSSAAGGETPPIRAASLLGYPNAAGVVLVATSMATVSLYASGGGLTLRRLNGLLAIQAAGLLATGSRLGLLTGFVAVVYLARRHWSRRTLLAAAIFSAPMVAVLLQRSVAGLPERIHLWRAAIAQIATDPLFGRGPAPELVPTNLAGARPTTHSHNEALQVAVEYGLIGLALMLLLLALTLRALCRAGRRDPYLALGGLAVAALALTDFALRITAVALVLALVTAPIGRGAAQDTLLPVGPKD